MFLPPLRGCLRAMMPNAIKGIGGKSGGRGLSRGEELEARSKTGRAILQVTADDESLRASSYVEAAQPPNVYAASGVNHWTA